MVTIVVLVVTGCGLRPSAPVVWDLRTPTTPSDIDPERVTAIGHEGASSYTVMFPTRTIEGPFRRIRATSPIDVSLDPYRTESTHIDTVSLVLDPADEIDTVLANIDTVKESFDVDEAEESTMDAFVSEVEAKVAANGGEIDGGDFVPGASGFRSSTLGVERDEAFEVVLLIGVTDDAFSMTLVVRFDNGTTDDWT